MINYTICGVLFAIASIIWITSADKAKTIKEYESRMSTGSFLGAISALEFLVALVIYLR